MQNNALMTKNGRLVDDAFKAASQHAHKYMYLKCIAFISHFTSPPPRALLS